MKSIMKFIAPFVVMFFLCGHLHAQTNDNAQKVDKSKIRIIHAARDTSRDNWLKALVFVTSIHNDKDNAAVKDTAIGTGFLLSDQGKLYLVTAKNIIASANNGQMPNDNISVSCHSFTMGVDTAFKLSGLADNDHHAVAFTADGENVAIISLQSPGYKAVAANLLAHGCRSIPVSKLDMVSDLHAGEELTKYGRNMIGTYKSLGWAICFIKDVNPKLPFFNINRIMLDQGVSGSIAVANEKLVGIMTDGTEASSQTDNRHLHWISIPAKFTKAPYILSCLRKLQQTE